jgi:pimeloyl-ACP methyl ester carboxylesterase
MKPPVIVVPGITATALRDAYPGDAESIWNLMSKDYERSALHPDDLRYEQVQPSHVRVGDVFSIPYDNFVGDLRHDLSPARDRPRPVYLFPYDWRQPLDRSVERLAEFIESVIARTVLLRHYQRGAGYTQRDGRVDLVGHSMGGLLIAGYLARRPRTHRTRKAITLGTPFGGSFEAVIKVVTGTADLGGDAPSSRERETARLTPALYHLVPTEGLDVEGDRLPSSLFDAGLWQPGVIESIAEHLRLNGLSPARARSERLGQATILLQALLDRAADFRATIGNLDLAEVGLDEADWLSIAGIGERTRVALRIEDRGPAADEGPWFDLASVDRKNGYPLPELRNGVVTADLTDTGDGTVPYLAARPPFVPHEALVCVATDDFGYWEIADRLLRRFTNLHSMLPAMNRVTKLCGAFLDAEQGQRASAHPGLQGRRSPECLRLGTEWAPPFVGLEEEQPGVFGGGPR